MMKLHVTSVLPCTLEQAIAQVKRPELFSRISAPLIRILPEHPEHFPDTWEAGTYRVQLKLPGGLSFGTQTLILSYPPVSDGFILQDDGHSDRIHTWHHRLSLKACGDQTRYTDDIEVDAGSMTPAVWAFSQILYRHRHRQWRRLIATGQLPHLV